MYLNVFYPSVFVTLLDAMYVEGVLFVALTQLTRIPARSFLATTVVFTTFFALFFVFVMNVAFMFLVIMISLSEWSRR